MPNGKMVPKWGKEQDAKDDSYPTMTKTDDNCDPFMVSMYYFCGWEWYAGGQVS